ncbi:MAG: hypothetical protein QMD08_01495 [Actinomycetota bacterium]|nr:hypothetical protein [Actinomycetota bacterium]
MEKLKYSRKNMRFIKRRRRAAPLRLLLLLILILALIYLVGLIGGRFEKGRLKDLRAYATSVDGIARTSNKVAADFNELWEATDLSESELRRRLDSYIEKSEELVEECGKMDVPREMEDAHIYLSLCLELRAKGLSSYKLALFGALEDIDVEVASGQIALALKDITLADRAYSLYRVEAQGVLEKKDVGASIPESTFLKDETVYEKTNLVDYIKRLKGVEELEEVHGVAITALSTQPEQKKYDPARGLAELPRSEELLVVITVENQGNQVERDIPVVVTLKSEIDPREQKRETKMSSLLPGEKKTSTISGLKPVAGVVNLLTVTVGPVPNEKYTRNNVREFKFTMP